MVSSELMPRKTGAAKAHNAASACAYLPAPNRRAILPVRNTTPAPASAGRSRRAGRNVPSETRTSAAISAINGGKST